MGFAAAETFDVALATCPFTASVAGFTVSETFAAAEATWLFTASAARPIVDALRWPSATDCASRRNPCIASMTSSHNACRCNCMPRMNNRRVKCGPREHYYKTDGNSLNACLNSHDRWEVRLRPSAVSSRVLMRLAMHGTIRQSLGLLFAKHGRVGCRPRFTF